MSLSNNLKIISELTKKHHLERDGAFLLRATTGGRPYKIIVGDGPRIEALRGRLLCRPVRDPEGFT